MSRIIYKVGDLTKASEYCIAHGCNAQGVMGSGVAKAIREAFPGAYQQYMSYHNSVGLQLGHNCYWEKPGIKLIVNMITQRDYGREARRYVSYDALASCLRGIDGEAEMRQSNPLDADSTFSYVALPKVGAGLGGGDWKILRAIIESSCQFLQPVVYVMNESEIDD